MNFVYIGGLRIYLYGVMQEIRKRIIVGRSTLS